LTKGYDIMHRALIALTTAALCLAGACGSNDPSGPNNPPPTPSDVDIVVGASLQTTGAFAPNPKTVALAGGASVGVRWVNTDAGSGGGGYGGGSGAVAHRIASDNGAFATSPTLGGGATYSVNFTQAGTYHFHCEIHPNMVGTITVSP
jgi:plastocyanin